MEANNEKTWERPWSTEEIRQNASNWNLAGDAGLLGHLQQFSQTLVAQTHAINKALDSQFEDLNRIAIDIDNQTNDLSNLCNTQFVENRVYEDQEIETPTEERIKAKLNVSKEDEYIANVKKALSIGMSVLDTHFHEVDVEDTDGEDDSSSSVGGKVLLAKDPYSHRPLPHLIGSREFMDDDSVGLAEVLSDNEDMLTPRLTANSSDSDLRDDGKRHSRGTTSESEGSDDVDNIVFRRSSDRMFEDEPSDMFGLPNEDAPPVHSNSQASFADELASKLGGVASQAAVQSPSSVPPKQSVSSKADDLFSPGGEDSDELDDSLFGVGKGRFSGGRGLFDDLEEDEQKNATPPPAKESKPVNLFTDDIFGSANDDADNIFSTNKKAAFVDKAPIGGQRHLGIPQGQQIGGNLKSISDDSDRVDLFKSENISKAKNVSNLFDDEDEDDLFAVGTNVSKSSSMNVSSEPKKKKSSILKLPSSNSSDVSNVSSQITRSIYLPDDTLDQSDLKNPSPSHDFLQPSITNSIKVENNSSARKSDFTGSLISDNLFSEAKESSNKTVNRKPLSLFDESDSGEEEALFSTHSPSKRSLNSPSVHSKNSLSFEPNKEKTRSSLFDNTNTDNLFGSNDLFKEATLKTDKKTNLFDFDDDQDDIFAVTSSNKKPSDLSSSLFSDKTQTTDKMTPPKSLNIRKTVDLFAQDDENDDLFDLPVDKKTSEKPRVEPKAEKVVDLFSESPEEKMTALKIQSETKKIDIFGEAQGPLSLPSSAATWEETKKMEEAPKTSPRKMDKLASERPTTNTLPKESNEAKTLPNISPKFADTSEENNLFAEPVKHPEIAKRKPQVVPRAEVVQRSSDVPSKSTGNAAETVTTVEPEKVIGKIKTPVGLLIDPKTMLPGARPPREGQREVQSPTDVSIQRGDSPETDRTSSQSITPVASAKISPKSPTKGEDFISPSNTREFIFDTSMEVAPKLHSVSKERAKIQVKRRPQSRKARQESIRTSAIFPDQPEQGTSKEEGDVFHRVDPSSSKDQVAKILPLQSTSKISDSFNPTSPSTDEEDLFGVPQDLYESAALHDSLFGDSNPISPGERGTESKGLFEDDPSVTKVKDNPLGLFDSEQPSNKSSVLTEEKNGSKTTKPSRSAVKEVDDVLFEAKSKPISLFGDNGYIGDRTSYGTEKVVEDKASLFHSKQSVIDSSSSSESSLNLSRETKSTKDSVKSPLGLFDDPEDLFSSRQHSVFQKEGVFDEESDSLFYPKKPAKESSRTKEVQDDLFPTVKTESAKREGIFDEDDLFLPKLQETFKETKGATRKVLKDDLFRQSNRDKDLLPKAEAGLRTRTKDINADRTDRHDDLFRTSKNTIVFEDENDDFLFPAASGSLQEAFNDSKDNLFQNQESLFPKAEVTVNKKVDFNDDLFTDDDDSLFASSSVKKTKPEEVKVKAGSSKVKKTDLGTSLFGDDDEIEDIFNINSTKTVPAKKTVDTTVRKAITSTRPVKTTDKKQLFEDPLMALQK